MKERVSDNKGKGLRNKVGTSEEKMEIQKKGVCWRNDQ